MAGGPPILLRMASLGIERNRCSRVFPFELDFPWSLISFVSGMRQLQGGCAGFVVCGFSGQGLVRPPLDSVWLRLSGRAADCSSDVPPERTRSAMADPAPFLPLGQHLRSSLHR